MYVDIPDIEREKELNLRLNKNVGQSDYELLAEFDETLLADVGFTSEELDEAFSVDIEEVDDFDLKKELKKARHQRDHRERGRRISARRLKTHVRR